MRSWDLMHEVIASMPVVITEVTPMRDDDEEQITVVQEEAVVQEEEAVVQVTPMRDRLPGHWQCLEEATDQALLEAGE